MIVYVSFFESLKNLITTFKQSRWLFGVKKPTLKMYKRSTVGSLPHFDRAFCLSGQVAISVAKIYILYMLMYV